MPMNPLLTGSPEEQDPEKKAQISSGETALASTGGGGQSAISGGATPAAAAKQPSTSGSYTNLKQYLQANEAQGAGLGARLESGVQKSATQAQTALAGAGREFKGAQEAANVRPEEFTAEKVSGVVAGAKSPAEIEPAVQSFADVRAKEQKALAGTGVEPKALTELASYQGAKGKLTEAQQQAQMTGSEAGRQQLLAQTFQRPDYSKGQQSLDQLLTQNVPETQKRFESLRQNILGQYGLGGQEQQAIQQAATTRQQAQAGTDTAYQNINQVLYGQLGRGYKYGTMDPATNLPTILDSQGNKVNPAPNGAYPEGVVLAPGGATQQLQPPQGQAIGAAPAQYGVLTSLSQQLAAAPQTAQTALVIDYNNKATAIRQYLQKTYGDKPFGADLDTLVQNIMGGPAPVATTTGGPGEATLQNVTTPEQWAQVQALNALAGRDQNIVGFGEQAKVLGSTIPGQVPVMGGTAEGFKQTAPDLTQLKTVGQTELKNRADIVSNDIQSKTSNALTQAKNLQTDKFLFGDPSNPEPHPMTFGMNPNKVANAWNQVYYTQEKALKDINDFRTQNGLPKVEIPSDAIKNEYNRLLDKYINIKRYQGDFSVGSYARQLKEGHLERGAVKDFWHALLAMSRTNVQRNLIQQIHDNPLSGVPGTEMSEFPTSS